MKKILFFASCLMIITLASCNDGKSKNSEEIADSLQQVLTQRDSELDDMLSLLNDVEEGFREINTISNRMDVARAGEGSSQSQNIKDNIHFIKETLIENNERIAKLNALIKNSNIKSEQLKRTIENLTKQLEAKNEELQKMREELDAKNIHISELDETINELNTNVDNLNSNISKLSSEGEQKSETIDIQDKQLNTAWYVFGTKKELKEQNVLSDGKVLQENFNRNYFTKIDIRVLKEIPLHSKSAKILTTHPADSYKLEKDSKKQYTLRITKPETFWSTSKYLVIQVK